MSSYSGIKQTSIIVLLFILILSSCSSSVRCTGFDNGVRTFILFQKNSSQLTDLEILRINEFAMDIPAGYKVYIRGSADSKNETNCKRLASERVFAIKRMLIYENQMDPMLIEDDIQIDAAYSETFSRSAILTISKK